MRPTGLTSASAAVVQAPGDPFAVRDVEIAPPGRTEVLVKIEASGICAADVMGAQGKTPFPLPGVLGHEGVGVVEQVGPDVDRVRAGDRVVLTFDSCGGCAACLRGVPTQCETFVPRNFEGRSTVSSEPSIWMDGTPLHGRFFQQSSFGTFALASQRNAVPVSTSLPGEVLAPLGCGVQAGAGAVLNVLRPRTGMSIVVFGLGAVGMSAVMAAALTHGVTVIAVDVNPGRLQVAAELGAAHTANPVSDDVTSIVRDVTGGGADQALVCTPAAPAFPAAFESVRTGGEVGVVGGEFGLTVPLDVISLVNSSRRIIGIVSGAAVPSVFLPMLVDLVESGAMPMHRLVKAFALTDIASAVASMQDGSVVKPVLVM